MVIVFKRKLKFSKLCHKGGHTFIPNKFGISEGSFSSGDVNLTPLHISRGTNLISKTLYHC